jgi:N-methylhydantoinase A
VRVGIEVGGTFTDLLSLDEAGRARFVKVPSIPQRPDEGAYAALAEAGIDVAEIHELVHGSTVATNAVLERSGARVAFITTQGFRDILLMQRHHRHLVFELAYQKPTPIVPRRDCFEVTERILADGSVETAIDPEAVERTLLSILAGGGYEAVAICLLNAYANPAHERTLAELIGRRLPDLMVTCSSDTAPEFREYERASTTVIAAHVQPVISDYLGRFERYLESNGFTGSFSLMQSNGGRLPSTGMRRNPVTALFSGPAAGVMGAVRQAGLSGCGDLVTFDMGGTSTDVCLVENGEPELTSQTEIDGLPVRTPLFDIVSVGAGCGSIVWVDDGGMLRVGPQSAGADPGPACYGRGGDRPTITDAHIIQGTIRPDAFLGGAMEIDTAASHRVFADVAAHFDMSLPEMADSAIRLADANVVRAIQLISTERGRDPRDYVLVAFGGAGPLHAARVAEDLDIHTILVPPYAGVLSAYGLLASDYRLFETRTRRIVIEGAAPAAVRETVAEMRNNIVERFRDIGLGDRDLSFNLTLEMRFVGQAFEVPVDIDLAALDRLSVENLLAAFADAHHRVYFHGAANRNAVEVVSFRLGAVSPLEQAPALTEARDDESATAGRHRIFDGSLEVECKLMRRSGLSPGQRLGGPAIVDDVTSTIFVPAGWRAEIDDHENLIMKRSRS